MMTNELHLLPKVFETLELISKEFDVIKIDRKNTLNQLGKFIQEKAHHDDNVNLNFICTHNSRRSHMAQLWSQAAALYYQVPNVFCFSGGTVATAFNQNAVNALQYFGFQISKASETENPLYLVRFSETDLVVEAFSKRFDDPVNPQDNFVAILTCSDADEACPVVPGASARFLIKYDDPKMFDGTELEQQKYRETALEIGREMMFAFSRINS